MDVVGDGAEALEYLFATGSYAGRDSRDAPKLVLLDLKLPEVGGLEVLERLRADPRTHRLPVVVLTSSIVEGDLGRCYDLGANSYIRKPVDFAQFMEAVKQLARTGWCSTRLLPAAINPGRRAPPAATARRFLPEPHLVAAPRRSQGPLRAAVPAALIGRVT